MLPSVLHISTADNLGGSGRSAYKIHCGLRQLGVRSRMLVRDRSTSDDDVQCISRGWIKAADKLAEVVTEHLALQYLLVPSTYRLLQHPWFRQADVVQLYNTHGNYFSHTLLPRIAKEKVVVWRLSDMWPFTGHCAYAGFCEGWRTGCGNCPDLSAYPGIRRDSTRYLWNLKKRIYARSRIQFVAPSRWIMTLAKQSPLIGSLPIKLIRNGINPQLFKPLPRSLCRQVLGIDPRQKAILYLAHSVRANSRKGSDHFLRVVQSLSRERPGTFLVMVVGEGAGSWETASASVVWRHDLVREDELLAMIYNAADLLVHPAMSENLPNSILEAMACGLAVVAYDTGGVAEVVEHGSTGWLVSCGDERSLLAGIVRLLEDDAKRLEMGQTARSRILADFTVERQASEFLSLYHDCLQRRAAA